MKFIGVFSICISACALLLFGCTQTVPSESDDGSSISKPNDIVHSSTEQTLEASSSSQVQYDEESCYFDELIATTISSMDIKESDSDFKKIEKAFVYVIENTDIITYDNASLTNSWRAFYECENPPTPYEEMSTCLLEYGLASCENYASALVVILNHMGFEAKYVPGLTYSVYGDFVRHAWTIVKVDDAWYHLDANLEDHISNTHISFKYFMKDDATFAASHAWGDLLLHPSEYSLSLPECTGKLETPAGHLITEPMEKLTLEEAVEIATEYTNAAGENYYTSELTETLPSFPVTNQVS